MRVVLENTKYLTWNEVIRVLGRSWGGKKKLFDDWEEMVGWAIYMVKNKPNLPYSRKVDILIKCYRHDKRLYDADGICEKPIIDALVRNGVLKDDNCNYVSSITKAVVNGADSDKIIIDII